MHSLPDDLFMDVKTVGENDKIPLDPNQFFIGLFMVAIFSFRLISYCIF